MPDGEMLPVGDEMIFPVTTETIDENGNTVLTGYPSGSSQAYVGTPITNDLTPIVVIPGSENISEGL